ncbi:hypothetical protein FM106_21995 [Brachybacterium faecium]|nr:hypothetical protein FM106_21995 [Brachybacterium faecium]
MFTRFFLPQIHTWPLAIQHFHSVFLTYRSIAQTYILFSISSMTSNIPLKMYIHRLILAHFYIL